VSEKPPYDDDNLFIRAIARLSYPPGTNSVIYADADAEAKWRAELWRRFDMKRQFAGLGAIA